MIEKCRTKGGPDPNKECVFPFMFVNQRLYIDANYSKCPIDHVGKPWCPTKLDEKGIFRHYIWNFTYPDRQPINRNWGYCDDDCEIIDLPAGKYRSFLHYDVQNLYRHV